MKAKLGLFAGLFCAGVLLAAGLAAVGGAQETTTETATTVETVTDLQTTTEAQTTTETVQQTTTRRLIVTAPTTTSADEGSGDTPAWVWALVAALALAAVVLLVLLLSRRGGKTPPPAAHGRQLDAAVSSWLAQGYALERRSADSAIVRRGADRLLVSVDAAGTVSTQRLADAWPEPPPAG